MARQGIEKRFYKSFSALSTQDSDYVVPNGKTLNVLEIGGNAAQKPTTTVVITWDPGGAQEQILFSTVGDASQNINMDFIGDGTRKMRISLNNQDTVAQILGGYYLGIEVDT